MDDAEGGNGGDDDDDGDDGDDASQGTDGASEEASTSAKGEPEKETKKKKKKKIKWPKLVAKAKKEREEIFAEAKRLGDSKGEEDKRHIVVIYNPVSGAGWVCSPSPRAPWGPIRYGPHRRTSWLPPPLPRGSPQRWRGGWAWWGPEGR